MVTFQFDQVKDVALFENESPELCLVSFETKAKSSKGNDKQIGALIVHRGRISSLEFKIFPKLISAETLKQVIAKYRGTNPQIASSIDKEDHDLGG